MKNDEKLQLIQVPRELHKQVKLEAVRTGKPLREVIAKILAEWVAKQGKKEGRA